jgi:integrase
VFQSERGDPMTPKSFHALFGRIGVWAKMPFPIHPHMLRHACGYALATAGHDTRALQAWLGHKNIQHTSGTLNWRRIGSRTSSVRAPDLFLLMPAAHIDRDATANSRTKRRAASPPPATRMR